MPSSDRSDAVTLDVVHERVATLCFPERDVPPADDCCPGLIGLEPEIFAYFVDAQGNPRGRAPLRTQGDRPGVVDILGTLAVPGGPLQSVDVGPGKPPEFVLANGGRITFEPGAQIEHSTIAYRTSADAQRDTLDVFCLLQKTLKPHSIVLASTGVDLFENAETVPQQHEAARYRSMAAYFDARGPHGRTMMRLSASQQINLDLGTGATLRERWLLGNLLSPIITAAFSASPKDGFANARAIAWQGLDPTRSGYPELLVSGASDDPVEQYADAALSANPMLFWTESGEALPGQPGFTFRDWMTNGRPGLGYPTLSDLEYHLTTLFLEVRPRGFFELRSCDALPAPWRIAPTVLLTGLIYCGRSRTAALDRLSGWRPRLPELWRTAAERGMAHEELGSASADVLQLGLEGAHRMPVDYFSLENLAIAERYLETFTRRHRAPADELAERLAQGPAAALAWAAGHADCESAVEQPS